MPRSILPIGFLAATLSFAAWPAGAAAPASEQTVRAAQEERPPNPCLDKQERRKLICPRWHI